MKKRKFYIEYFERAPAPFENPIADTFHLPIKSLKNFLKAFKAGGKNIVHLQLLDGDGRILYSKRRIHHKH